MVGTWDGAVIRLFVNGAQVAAAAKVGTNIQYPDGDAGYAPPNTALVMGTYNDTNEHYPLVGSIRNINLYVTRFPILS